MRSETDRLLSWASVVDEAALTQAKQTSSLPFVYPHVALMPDAHLGKGATVGSVIPTDGAVVPAAVGVDIGCGMLAVRTRFTRADLLRRGPLTRLRVSIERAVPLSAGRSNRTLTPSAETRVEELRQMPGAEAADQALPAWPRQLGSLGSGNHFIEVSADEDDRVWLFLHSGSRGVGNRLAGTHIRVAQDQAKHSGVDLPNRDLAYLVEGTLAFDAYITDLRWAQHYAALNRDEMMDRVTACLARFLGVGETDVATAERIQCHHNYTQREHHFGRDVWLSRKGAIDAGSGVAGLIPGSMGTASYVVVGTGNDLALRSAPHGAGRAYSRSQARKKFTRAQLRASMEGIEYRDSEGFLDEIPGAYKDVDTVLADAADLVEVRHTLRQVVNVKGA